MGCKVMEVDKKLAVGRSDEHVWAPVFMVPRRLALRSLHDHNHFKFLSYLTEGFFHVVSASWRRYQRGLRREQ